MICSWWFPNSSVLMPLEDSEVSGLFFEVLLADSDET